MRENVSSGGGESDSLSRPGASGQRETTECECEVPYGMVWLQKAKIQCQIESGTESGTESQIQAHINSESETES